ncbi:unnamed protein product [Cylindrotheca closterium]|uniref:Uncharacterized protein n=1 Tax=Cylindrotheca closterium TaxID=2856 RepID=A0AAD2CE60_9STRA|nr:unnamed protein product [Cylindrotheca closterium]
MAIEDCIFEIDSEFDSDDENDGDKHDGVMRNDWNEQLNNPVSRIKQFMGKSKAEMKKLKAGFLTREIAALQAQDFERQLIVAMNSYKDCPVAVEGVRGKVTDVIIQMQGGVFDSASFVVEFDGPAAHGDGS